MRDEVKAELTLTAILLLFDVIERYVDEGYTSSEKVKEAREKLKKLDKKLMELPDLQE